MEHEFKLLISNFNPENPAFIDELKKQGFIKLIPINNLFGTQPPNEYNKRKEQLTKTAYKNCGIIVLAEHPPLVCEIDKDYFAVLDGHHRIRFLAASSVKAQLIPCVVISLDQYASYYNLSVEEAQKRLESQTSETTKQFSQRMSK